MKNKQTLFQNLIAVSIIAATSPSVFACSSCGCTLSSDWDSQGYSLTPGIRVDLRYDYLAQSQLRSGTGKVNRDALELPTDKEIEQSTKNQYTTIGFDYSQSKNWGVNVQLPYIYRTHTTIAEGDTEISSSKTSNIGDARILGRYQGFTEEQNVGLQFGLKLPTGSFQDTFRNGPQAGEALDRGLQAGSGSTDLMLGVFHFGTLDKNWDYFAQGMAQQALNQRDGYKTGTSVNINVGLRYMADEDLIPQLQINAKAGKRDSGINADSDNSGGTLVYLSPGLTVGIGKNMKLFGFLQLPLYQKVNGLQLTPRYTFSLGIRSSI